MLTCLNSESRARFSRSADAVENKFLCRDSILAAPLAIEIARYLDLAKSRREKGVQEQLSTFFKLLMLREKDAKPENALHKQQELLLKWLQN